ncbi:hypothetical protein QFC19_000786 [Naganishia cerealis]|uniref:Uncharacterized protein n=1 Tax=Naganishia cerealis TaxID=610337 RepID=A0ACC2WMQ4_9TREE|nr:hypothetical protein QFC19_000786 [Naganishia cerealis]
MSDCSFGECVRQYVIDQALGVINGSNTGKGNSLNAGVIAGLAVVGAILALVVAGFIAGYLRQRKARKKPLVENDDGLFGGAPKRGVGLEWSNVGYVVRGEKSGLSAALAGGAFGFGRAKRQVTPRAGRPSAGTRNRVVLNNVSGRLPPGGFCCILGPSGAGKSTFVDILAGKRKGNGIVSGNVKLFVENGERSNGKHRIGFVDQSDILAPMSTVREALLFAAHLRLPENIPEAVKQERAHEVMQQLGLGDVADTRIGDVARRGISGGEMRRLSIGLELIAAPDILILDEPTSVRLGDKSLLIAHIGLACILGVFAGGLYFKVDITISGFQNRVGSLFFLGVLLAFMSLSALYNLIEIRPLFLRERAASFYSTIVYWMVGLSPHADRFFKFLLILVEYGLQLTVHNFLLAALIRNGGIAILLSSLYNLFLMTYAGFFVNIGKIPPVLRWLRYFSTLNYALEALAVNEVNSGLLIDDVLAGVNVQVSASLIMETLFGFDSSHYYRDVLILFAFLAGYSGILVLTVWYWLKESR